MFLECLPYLDGLQVTVGVILLVTESKTALAHAYYVGVAVLEVRSYTHVKVTSHAVRIKLYHIVYELLTTADGPDTFHIGTDGRHTLGVTAVGVHDQVVEVCYAGSVTAGSVVLSQDAVNQVLELLTVTLGEFLISSVTCKVIGQRIGIEPSSAAETVEILTGPYATVQVLLLYACKSTHLLPDTCSLVGSQIKCVVRCNAECLIPGVDVRQGAVHTPAAQ